MWSWPAVLRVPALSTLVASRFLKPVGAINVAVPAASATWPAKPAIGPALTLGMAPRQRRRHAIDEDLIIEQLVDVSKRRVPELVTVGQEDFDEAALPVATVSLILARREGRTADTEEVS